MGLDGKAVALAASITRDEQGSRSNKKQVTAAVSKCLWDAMIKFVRDSRGVFEN